MRRQGNTLLKDFSRWILREGCWYQRSPEQQRFIYEKYYPLILQNVRKWYTRKLNPFNLCPRTIMIWLLIRPYNAIGINLIGLRKIAIFWRQQMEPNETIFLLFRVIDLHIPFPLMLLITFGSLGLVITDGANRLLKAAQMQFEETITKIRKDVDGLADTLDELQESLDNLININTEEDHKKTINRLDPFNLTTRMSVYLPIYNYQTTLGILLMDFRHLEISIKQSLEPNETLFSLIRFIDVYSPFPLPIMVMLLLVGLFFVGKIQDLNHAEREEIISKVKRSIP